MSRTAVAAGARTAGPVQGWVLVAAAWLAVMANQVIAPVLPTMRQFFSAEPRVDLLISLTATLPALFVAALAGLFGLLGDRVGHKRVLFGATLLYGVVGTAPIWLATLPGIVVSRALVGVAEAAIMTCSTALLVGHFAGRSRERYLAFQTGTAPIIAVIVTVLGGALGESSWRNPFFIYGFAFVLIPLTGLLVREAARGQAAPVATLAAADTATHTVPFRWGTLLWRCCVSIFAMAAFLVTAIQTSFVLTERGLTSPASIGFWTSGAMLANPVGALIFGLSSWRSVPKLALSFALMCAGLLVMALLPYWQSAIVGAAIANFGAGMILPTLIIWTLSDLPDTRRGQGTGVWMSAAFLGQFLSPLSILGLKAIGGNLSAAILVYAIACGACALIAAMARRERG
jgi:MFS family permease